MPAICRRCKKPIRERPYRAERTFRTVSGRELGAAELYHDECESIYEAHQIGWVKVHEKR